MLQRRCYQAGIPAPSLSGMLSRFGVMSAKCIAFMGANIPRTVEQAVSHGRTRLAAQNVNISLKAAVCYYHPYCAGKPPSYEQISQCVPSY